MPGSISGRCNVGPWAGEDLVDRDEADVRSTSHLLTSRDGTVRQLSVVFVEARAAGLIAARCGRAWMTFQITFA
jgi:hypothetical protein